MKKKFLAILGGSLITLSAIGAVTCSSITIYLSKQLSRNVTDVQGDVAALSKAYIVQEQKKVDPEYVTIDQGYEVRDTSAISNAYLTKDDSKLTKPEDKETLKLASDLLKQITNDKMSLYEKELAIHDWLALNVHNSDDSLSAVPSGNGPTFTPYGVLKSKKAVCVGYATTFKLLMNMLGTECMVEHNLGLGHSWNVVKLDDDNWYLVDLYSDANASTSKNVCHQSFNLTNDDFNANGPQFDTSLYPVAAGTKYSYAVQNSKPIDDIKKLPKLMKDNMNKKITEVYYKLPANFDTKYIAAIDHGVRSRSTDSDSLEARYIKIDENNVILSLVFTYPDTSDTDESHYPELQKELDKLFGSSSYDN